MNSKRRVLSILLSVTMIMALLPINFVVSETKVSAGTAWRSALYPENWTPGYSINNGTQYLQDFSYAGYEKGEKALPTTMSGTTANVLDYGADNTGANDATSAIQNAINAVQNAGGGTVYLPAGTYKVKPSGTSAAALKITGSNILFKGDGIGKTFIRCYAENMYYCQVILVQGDASWDSVSGASTNLSKDILTPTTTIPVNSTSGFSVGDYVVVRSDRTQGFIDEHQMNGFWSASLNPTTMGPTFYRQIKSINASNKTIEIDIPTRYALKTRDNARIYKVKTPTKTNVGLMDFSIGNKMNSKTNGWGEEDYKTSGTGAYEANQAFLIKFSNSVNCFAKNIATYQAGNSSQIHMTSNGLDLNKTKNVTVENCDFSHPQYEGGGGNGYGINICGQETLIKDCSSTSARHSFAFKYSYANGNVIYHYTSTDPKYGSDFHMYLSMSNLIDNEELNGDFVESVVRPYGGTAGNRHGVTSSQTVFWNTKGNRYKSGTNYIIDSRQHGYGYIIGTQGAATNVKTTPTSMSSSYGNPDTAPEDYKEGIGQGADLVPQSLYYDQLTKRLGGSAAQPAVTSEIPGTFNATDYSTVSSGITSNTTDGGVNYVGNLSGGSSLEYKVNAIKTGKYRLDLKAVSGNSNSTRTLSVYSGETLLTTLTVPNKTDWFDFTNISAEVNIPTLGEQTLKITSTGSANISDIQFTKLAETIPGTVSVGAYSSKTDTITFTTTGNTLYAGNLNSNSALDYTVNVAEAGQYQLNLKFAAGDAQWNAKNMIIKLDDQTVATVSVQGSSSWETFVDHNATINIAATGQHKLSIVADGGSCNVADFTAEKMSSSTEPQTTQQNIPDATLPQETLPTTGGGRVVGYLPSYRSGVIDQIDYSALTHFVISFMTYSNGTLTPGFSGSDVQKIVSKCHANNVKVMVALGGGGGFNTSGNPFGTASSRTNVINGLMDYVNQYNLDGIDIDIEVSDANTWANFDAFVSELSGRLKPSGKLLTMAVSSWFTGSIQNSTYNYFDFINLMTYDENAGNGPVASMNFVNNQIAHYKSKGISDDRLVIGVPFYGYGPGGYSDAYTYAQILSANANNRWSDTATINGKTVYYNGENTIKEKAELSKSYGGIMIWELGQDSFGANSLLSVIKNTVGSGTTVTNPTITNIPGTVAVDSYVSKSNEITLTTGATTYAGNLNDGSTLNYYIRVPEAGKYTFTFRFAAGNAQYNAKNMIVKLNDQNVATVPVQASTDWEVFIDHKTDITFNAKGEYKISLVADSGACNVANFTAEKAVETTTKAQEITKVEETTKAVETTKVEETTKASTGVQPLEVFGTVVNNVSDNTITVVWGQNDERIALGQTYNVYVDGEKKLSGVICGEYKLENIGAGNRTVKVTAVLGSNESEGQSVEVNVSGVPDTTKQQTTTEATTKQETTTEEQTTKKPEETTTEQQTAKASKAVIEIDGCQISTAVEGYRVVYSVIDSENDVVKEGLVYGLTDYISESDLYVGSTKNTVYSYEANDEGKLNRNYNATYENAQSYAMTMKLIKTVQFYNASISVKAYAQLKDGTYIYSEPMSFSVYSIANALYQNQKMNSLTDHNYLYDNILTVVNPNYEPVDFNWNKTIVTLD